MFRNKKIILCSIGFFIFAFLILTLPGCPTEPPIDNTPPGRRDYVWTVDTLNYPYDPMLRMWGSSPTDVWTTSSGFWDRSISHFDGERWSSYGVMGIIKPWAIYGFSENEVYIGAENGRVWKFNGSSWIEFAQLTDDGTDFIVFENIWGESSNDFYAVGNGPDSNGYANYSFISHFINNKWTALNTSELTGNVAKLYKNKVDGKIYLLVYKIGGLISVDSTIVYEYTNGKYLNLYSSVETKGLQADISLINNEVYFVLGSRIAIRVNNNFQTVLEVNNLNFYQRIWGRSSKDIFLLMTDGLAHYNGSNIEYLFYFNKTPRTQIFGAALFETEVFFLVYESQTNLNLIYHGILKEA